MVSSNLDVGANARMDPNFKPKGLDATPIKIAQQSHAIKFLMAMQKLGVGKEMPISRIVVAVPNATVVLLD
jgi:hypothetical protein